MEVDIRKGFVRKRKERGGLRIFVASIPSIFLKKTANKPKLQEKWVVSEKGNL
jgi:hypothetical protein